MSTMHGMHVIDGFRQIFVTSQEDPSALVSMSSPAGTRPPKLSKSFSKTEVASSGDDTSWKVPAVKDGVQEPLTASMPKWSKVRDIFTSKKKPKGVGSGFTTPAKFLKAAKLAAAEPKSSKEDPRNIEGGGASVEGEDSSELRSPPSAISSPMSPLSRRSQPKANSPPSLSEFRKPWPASQKGGHTHKMVLKAFLEGDLPEDEMGSVIGAIKLKCEDRPSFTANGQNLLLTHKKTSAGDSAPLHSSRNPESRTFFMQAHDSQSLQQWMLEIVLGIERHNSAIALKTAEEKAAALAFALKNAKSKSQRMLSEHENMKILLSTEQEAHYSAQQQVEALKQASKKMDKELAFVLLSRFTSRILSEMSTKAAAFGGMVQYRASRQWMLRAGNLFLGKQQAKSKRCRFEAWQHWIAKQRQVARTEKRGARNLAANAIFAWLEEVWARRRFRRNTAVSMLFRARRVARLLLAVFLSLSFNATRRKSTARKLASARSKFERRVIGEWARTVKDRMAVASWQSHILKKARARQSRKTCSGAWKLWNCWFVKQRWRRRAVVQGRMRGNKLRLYSVFVEWSETALRARQLSDGMHELQASAIQQRMGMVLSGWGSVVQEWMRCRSGLVKLLSTLGRNRLCKGIDEWADYACRQRKERWCRRLLCRMSASRTLSSWRQVASNMAEVKAATHNRLCMRRLSSAIGVWKSYWGWERGLQCLRAANWNWEALEMRAENSVAPHGPGEVVRDDDDRQKSPIGSAKKPKSLSTLWGIGTEGWRPAAAGSPPNTRRAWESGGSGVQGTPKTGTDTSVGGGEQTSVDGVQGSISKNWRETVGGKLAVGLDEEFRKLSASCLKGKARQILLAMAGECGRRAFCQRKTRGAERRRQLWISRQVWSTWSAVCFNLPLQRTDGLPVWGSTGSPTANQREAR